ncbi:MAG TPA: trypsin-like peptidase domain-containing protein [Candidatus Bathyarchaeia archaeon]|nr:trypsin-like peptidase domain-containing protein [Candidatus Bathyarchaeia archaeon]
MVKRTEIIMLVIVLSFVIIIINIEGSVFGNTENKGHSLTNFAAAITMQNNGNTIAENNLGHPLLPLSQQTFSDTIPNSFKNVALSSSTAVSDQIPSLTTIFKQVENSVVQITAKTPNPNLQIIINGVPLSNKSTRLGSGFVYDKQGHIITNSHVIDGASTADVTFVDGNTYKAKVIGKDPSSDIAVLQITDNFSPENLVPLPIVNSSTLEVGQQVIAIGNPFGLSDTMTTGIVSQTGRLLPNPDTGFSTPGAIQTDAAINPGNSGGPLLNMLGQVVGINTAINSATGEFSGIGFAVPSNIIIKEIPTIIKTGTYNHPWIGIVGAGITPDIAQGAGLPRNSKGVVVASIQSRSPAERAGLQGITQNNSSNTQKIGDIITGVDGRHLRSMDDLISYIDLHKSIGDNIVLTVNRHGQIMNLNVALETRPTLLQNSTQQESILP